MNKKNLAIGLMSGTSADGLTVSLISVSPFKVLFFKNYPYPPRLQNKILSSPSMRAPELSELNFELGKMYADITKKFVKEFNVNMKRVAAIGSHGQTVIHQPKSKIPNTLQIGEAAFLSAEFNTAVVSNFRAKDMALGGEGAPLIPFFDEYIFGKGRAKVLLNVGGISNISCVGKGVKTFGFDTGPGNTLMDIAVQKVSKGKMSFDKNGAMAAKGKVNEKILAVMMRDAYFKLPPPKSLDKNYFGREFLSKYLPVINKDNINDILATLNMYTAKTIAYGVEKFVLKRYKDVGELIIAGGGAYNKTLFKNIQAALPKLKVCSSQKYDIDPLSKESAAMALMAYLAVNGKVNHAPHATGAKREALLGEVYL
ncbi:anhydro-N-acetylmuramic acid kinase [Parelusimicrobium proximum]|uniref:anhydro-N-acetylmuramic acid kinase n=1 Tax=Parelusimicrobium proximum TaxID=3228953 RepID=UPI003D182E5C